MLLNLKCPSCGQSQRASEEIVGRVLLCPSCGGGFHVAGSKPRPGSVAPPALSEARSRPAAIPPEPYRNSPRPHTRSASPRRLDPPELPDSVRSSPPRRESLPPWILGALGSAMVLTIASMVILVRSFVSAAPGQPSNGTNAVSRTDPQPDAAATNRPPLTTAQIVARCEPSVALVKGKASSGTGFLIRPGVIATNSHVIDHEFPSDLEVRFPSAPTGQQGPSRVALLQEDTKRDLAFLAIESQLPALEVAPSYRFVKGEDITVIGNPGLGDQVVLENAISRGVMSSRTTLEGLNYLQLNIAINPGNSGGPVFDSTGRVIGVATLKSTKAEAMAFCIPVEDVHAGLARLDAQPATARLAIAARHCAHLAFRLLTTAGALYSIGLETRAGILQTSRWGGPGPATNLLPNEQSQKLHEVLTTLEQKQFSLVEAHLPQIQADPALSETARRSYQELTTNYQAMRDLYANPSQPANLYAARAQDLKANHLRLVNVLQSALGIEAPAKLLAVLEARPAAGQPPALFADMIPPQMQPHLRAFPGPFPRIPFGPGVPGGFDPATDARAAAGDARTRPAAPPGDARAARALLPRVGP